MMAGARSEVVKLRYELNRMEFSPKSLKSDEHRARHPPGRVPVQEDGEVPASAFERQRSVEVELAVHDGERTGVDVGLGTLR
jgi:glutathione S-transferase